MTPNPSDEASQGGKLRPFLGPRSSSSERLKQFCVFGVPPGRCSVRSVRCQPSRSPKVDCCQPSRTVPEVVQALA
eukprot:14942234-Alexandrium_andersonii.AAC.1